MKKLILSTLMLLISCSSAQAVLYHNRKEAMKMAFPQADAVEQKSCFLTDQQIKKVEEIAHVRVESKIFTFFVGKKAGKILGYAAIDNHVVRTMPEIFLVALSPTGRLNCVDILSFSEPQEYLPTPRWFQQFTGKVLNNDLTLRRDISAVTGATMSSRALTLGVRKILAIFDLLVIKAP